MLVALGVAASRDGVPRGIRTLSRVGFAVFALGPQWLLPHGGDRELRWAWWEQILGGSYVWFAIAVLLITAFAVDRKNRTT
jgi:alpha-1,2-mannosyltransferase